MISLQNVSKRFKLYRRPSDRLLEWMQLGRRHQEFYALRHINLEIPAGHTVGIIGANGAGKSTLLKLITGVLLPSEGTISVRGRVAALLELGTGFHGEFTGRQNIHINGQLLGIPAEELKRLEPEIIGFSELGPFIDQPLRTYSSGMIMRLGFAVAASMRPEVLIVDEALSVGDARFSQKCIRRIREFREEGATILFVSHDPGAVMTLCDHAVLLDRGMVRSLGEPKDILDEYNALLAAQGSGNTEMTISRPSRLSVAEARRHGTFQAVISELEVLAENGAPRELFQPGDILRLHVRVDFLTDAESPSVGILLRDRLGLSIYGTNTALQNVPLGSFRAGEFVRLDIRLPIPLGQGDYSITAAVHEDETHLDACYEWADDAAIFRVRMGEKPPWLGVVRLQPTFEVQRGSTQSADLTAPLEHRFPDLPDPLPLVGVLPAPFLNGFSLPDAAEGSRKIEAASARMVFHPRGSVVELRLSQPEDASPQPVTISTSLAGELAQVVVPPGRSRVVVNLPPASAGRIQLVDFSFASAPPSLHLHAIRSCEVLEDVPEWPALIPARS